MVHDKKGRAVLDLKPGDIAVFDARIYITALAERFAIWREPKEDRPF